MSDWGAEYLRRFKENLAKDKERGRLLSEELQARIDEMNRKIEQAVHEGKAGPEVDKYIIALMDMKEYLQKKLDENSSLTKKESDDLVAWLLDKLRAKGKFEINQPTDIVGVRG